MTSAGAVTSLPTAVRSTAALDERAVPARKTRACARRRRCFIVTTSDYFQTMRIPVKQGKDFSDLDTADAPLVAIINESLARASFPNDDPIGQK